MIRYASIHIAGPRDTKVRPLTPARLADWCRRFTPLAAADAPDGAILDITGAAHLFGGEEAMLAEIEQRLALAGWTARAAIAPSPEAAWALARWSDVRHVAETADEKTLRRLFGPLPVAALRLDSDTVYALSQAGLKRIDDILHRPRAPITARFGAAVFQRIDAVLCRIRSPISPRFEAPAYLVERRFAEPLVRREDIENVLGLLASDLSRLLERHAEGARQLEASLFRADGSVHRIAAAASRPLRDPKIMGRLFAERLAAASEARLEDPLEGGFGFDVISLAALQVEALGARQVVHAQVGAVAADQEVHRPGPAPGPSGQLPADEDAADLIDRLGARLGVRRVLRLQPQASHIPERAVLAVPAAHGRSACRALWAEPDKLTSPTRPLRLFERPEPVETLAEVPDGPPLRFRWRRVMHEVAAIEGPERIAPEWWTQAATALSRDYFRVEDREGQRFWMFREGLYGSESPRPRWFMHGLFA